MLDDRVVSPLDLEAEYYRATSSHNYPKARSLFHLLCTSGLWTPERMHKESLKCGKRDEGELALIEEIVPGIDRGIDRHLRSFSLKSLDF